MTTPEALESRVLLTLTTPTILEPAASASTFDLTPQLQWTADPGAASYDVWVSKLGANPGAVYLENGVTDTKISVPNDLTVANHRFRIRSADGNGNKSSWSAGRNFTLTSDKPQSLSATGVSGTSATLTWAAVPGADCYTVWISQQGGRVQLVNDVSGTSYSASHLATGVAHTFWVRAVSSDHTNSAWSAGQAFQTTGAAIGTVSPVAINPGTIQNTTTAELSWTGVAGAASYRVWLDEVNGPTVFVVDDVQNPRYWAENLEVGKSYRYWVQGVDPKGQRSQWSSAVDFSVSATERPVSFHLPENPSILNVLSNVNHLIFDANTQYSDVYSDHNSPIFTSITVKAGSHIQSSGDLTLKVGTLILEEGASISANHLILQVYGQAFFGKDTLVSAGQVTVSGPVGLGDNAAMYGTTFVPNFVPVFLGASGYVYNQDTPADSDFDDLSDVGEIYAQTSGVIADTDGDWLSDGFESTNGLDPLTPFGDPGSPGFVWPDDDHDGLNLLEEQIFMTDPDVWDTDGGRSLGRRRSGTGQQSERLHGFGYRATSQRTGQCSADRGRPFQQSVGKICAFGGRHPPPGGGVWGGQHSRLSVSTRNGTRSSRPAPWKQHFDARL